MPSQQHRIVSIDIRIVIDMENALQSSVKTLLVCEKRYPERKCMGSSFVFRHVGVPSGRDGGNIYDCSGQLMVPCLSLIDVTWRKDW
jgi:hypothetical protein